MGKWERFRSKLPKFEIPPEWKVKVEKAKETYQALSPTELAREYKMQRELKDQFETAIKGCNTELEALSQLLVENLEGEELQKIQLASGDTVSIASDLYTTVNDKPAFHAWVKRNKLEQLLSMHYKTLNGLMKEMAVNGKPFPSCVGVYFKTSARLRAQSGPQGDDENAQAS